MFRIRLIEESIADKYSEQKMRCPTHLSIGQEAIAVGVSANLSNDDLVLSTHRAHAHYLAKGGDLNSMIAEIYGKITGCSKGMGGSMHLIDTSVGFMGSTAIVGNTIPVAVGLAWSLKLKESQSIACVYFGDGATEEGSFYESVNFAILQNLPIIFLCENNLYSVYSGLDVRQPKGRKIFEMVKGMGINSVHGDGNNVDEVFEKVKIAKEAISAGKGPQFLEFDTYRWREHCGPNYDNDIGYREESEFLQWQKNDPLNKFLESTALAELDDLKNIIGKEIALAHDFADNSEYPEYSQYKSIANL
ncbi:thiamine pyrophosphate-dependent dehydrogenase E1 component subunit alpha [Gammaproteobacteria bacterium]|nr:thiamine pyrophosphate-dependent dehydrogenase E1 component subunit alpha [Gammaproteobacteria bacterium]